MKLSCVGGVGEKVGVEEAGGIFMLDSDGDRDREKAMMVARAGERE